jgi:hypothetical protein
MRPCEDAPPVMDSDKAVTDSDSGGPLGGLGHHDGRYGLRGRGFLERAVRDSDDSERADRAISARGPGPAGD